MTNSEKYEILERVILFQDKIENLRVIISEVPWDSQEDVFIITKQILTEVMTKFILANQSVSIIEDWANILECREDIGYSNPLYKDIIDELANPILSGATSLEKIRNILIMLDNSKDLFDS